MKMNEVELITKLAQALPVLSPFEKGYFLGVMETRLEQTKDAKKEGWRNGSEAAARS